MAFCSAYLHYLIALSFCVLYAHASSFQADHTITNDVTKWAILVAGSKEWKNYRFQADICRAYQLLKAGGLKDEHIIVFMYDDIAYNSENEERYKGKIYSEGMSGAIPKEVYTGVPKDYTGNQVTRTNLYKVLLGERPWPGAKVLNTRPNDLVFIYYSGHGAQNFLEMPVENIGRRNFLGVLREMHHKNPHNKLVVYVEACNSGSMFEGSSARWLHRTRSNIFITTSSNSTHACYACPYYHTDYKAILCNLYSAAWMDDTEKYIQDPIHPKSRTLNEQYRTVRDSLAMEGDSRSNVMRFGSRRLGKEDIANFFTAN